VSESSTDASLVDAAVEAIRAGAPVVLPTDTVYGLCTKPEAAASLAALKGRAADQPIALLAPTVEALLEHLPELRAHEPLLSALLPGALTLVLANPARRYPELAGSRPETVGVRVPELSGDARTILERAGVVAATSANSTGGPDPRRIEDVPDEIRAASVLVDGGRLPGSPSTVVDLTGRAPKILREGAVPAAEVLERNGRLA
jgi:L-threonylcarbamoyladenylate synthase